jgi:hypothetical protein
MTTKDKNKGREAMRAGGRRGGKSRSAKKLRAAHKNMVTVAHKGLAVWRLKQDVEDKMVENRRNWLVANADERILLDDKFIKLNRVMEQLEKKSGKNGKA